MESTHSIHPTDASAARSAVCGVAFVLVLALGLGITDASAQTAQAPAPVGPASAPLEYQVGPGDLLAVTVFGVPELAQTPRVSNSGKIRLARVGVFDVYKMNAKEIEALIAKALTAKGLLNDPWVQVQVTQFRSSTVYILGEVQSPGQYAITSRMSVLDLVSMAEGLTPYADPVAFLYRLPEHAGQPPAADAASGTPERPAFTRDNVISIDIVALTQGKKPELNFDLRGGDILYTRRTAPKYYYVVGEVSRPGLYELTAAFENREVGPALLLSQAMAQAGGPTRTAKASQALLVRALPDGKLEQRPFDFDKVLRGKQPDWPVQVNDIIFIPGSGAKTLAYGLLGMLPNIVVAGTNQNMSDR
jgi:polysaccharide export outer membrane protein